MLIKQDNMEMAERIDCPAPLPEHPATALLTEMLVPAPYKVPEKKAEKKATGTRKGLRREVAPDASPKDDKAHSSHEGEEKNRKAAPTGEAERSKKEAAGTRKGLRRKAMIDSSSEDTEAVSSHGDRGNMKKCPLPALGMRIKGRPPRRGRLGRRRRERRPFRITPLLPPTARRSGCLGASPGRGRKYPHFVILFVRL